jgi:hypothetical protein
LRTRSKQAADEYSQRFGGEEGFRDTNWYLGFKKARSKDIRAWSRGFSLFVLALVILPIPGSEYVNRSIDFIRRSVTEKGANPFYL